MKRFLMAVLMLGTAISGFAYDKQYYELVLTMKDGSTITYQLDKKFVLTFADTKIVLESENVRAEYEITDISSFEQNNIPAPDDDAVESVTTSNSNGPVLIYDLNGRFVRSISADESRQAQFMIDDLREGVYVIKNGVTTYKIIKK